MLDALTVQHCIKAPMASEFHTWQPETTKPSSHRKTASVNQIIFYVVLIINIDMRIR